MPRKYYPLTPSQKIHFKPIIEFGTQQVANISICMTRQAPLDFGLLKKCIQLEYERYECLRIRFTKVNPNGEVRQYVVSRDDRDIDYENECFVVIDSETDIIYAVTFKEMEEAVLKNTFRNKLYYRINCDNYTWNRRVPVDENLIKVDYLYVSQMIECLKNTPEKNLVYLVKGYRYNIISKIIPYITAQEYYFIEAKKSDISTILHSIIDMWKKVNILISYEIKKNTFDFELIGKRLGQIEDYYKKNSKELQV